MRLRGNGGLALAAVLSLVAPVLAGDRVVTVALTDKEGVPLKAISANDVAVVENGVTRDVVDLVADTRPLSVALLVDTSEAVGSSYRLNIVPAIAPFLASLPEGSHYTLWTTGDRPTKRIEWSDDPREAEKALKQVFPQGGNTLLDSIREASKDLGKREAARTAVVVVTAAGVDFSNVTREQAVDDSIGKADVFYVLEILEGGSLPFNLEYALSNLAQKSGGLLLRAMSGMATEVNLKKITNDLASHQRLTYSEAADVKERKLAVNVAQPGAKARVLGVKN
jgi:hypothetical protein